METAKILEVIAIYRKRFEKNKVPKRRLDTGRLLDITTTIGQTTRHDLLAHAHYLLDDLEKLAQDAEKKGKVGRHLGSVQTLLLVCGWYTLDELMNHNRPHV